MFSEIDNFSELALEYLKGFGTNRYVFIGRIFGIPKFRTCFSLLETPNQLYEGKSLKFSFLSNSHVTFDDTVFNE